MQDKVYLVDGSGYIFRAYYALPGLTTSTGFPTNALYGFTRMLLRLLKEEDASRVIVGFDAGRQTFRNELFAGYKANRSACPDDLVQQMPYFRQLSTALGLPIAEKPGFEADDVIGTLARRFAEAGVEVVIVSGDKDLMQLVGERITMWDTMRDVRYGPAEVQQKMGVPPNKVVELLGLMGDSSDNVPGLAGVGLKTAVQLIEKYQDVEGVIASAGLIAADKSIRNRARICQEIESGADVLRLSRALVQVDCQVPVELECGDEKLTIAELDEEQLLRAAQRHVPRQELLRTLIERLEFSSLFKDLVIASPAAEKEAGVARDYRVIFRKDFPAWLEEFRRQPAFAFDVETTSLNVLDADLVGISFCWDDLSAWYIPLAHRDVPDGEEQVTPQELLDACMDRFADAAVAKYGQNMKYDIGVLQRHGAAVRGAAFDTMLASYLLNPDGASHSLASLSRHYLGCIVTEYHDVIGECCDFSYVKIPAAAGYAAEDAHMAWLLTAKLRTLLQERGLLSVMNDIEQPLVAVLARMELRGVRINSALLAKMSAECAQKLEALQARVFESAGGQFNLNSPKQLADVLFTKLGISGKGLKRTKSGISTDSTVLEKLSLEHELPALILDYRALHKLKSTYIDALPLQISPKTKRLHSKFNQTVTGTGRLSSSDPNLQNIPIQSEMGRKIRAAFIPEDGNVLISADYSQIELRVLAHLSGDDNLIAAFKEDIDIHAKTARELLGLQADAEVTHEQRRIGKTVNFGVIYGMSAFRLARDLNLPVAVARQYIEEYFAYYRGVSEFFKEVEARAERDGFVTTLFGRRRVISNIDISGRDKGFLRRVAINAPIQGTAADIIKLAMIKIDEAVEDEVLPLTMILQIHDELLFECT